MRKEAIHKKLIQDDTVSEHSLSVATEQGLLATMINPQHNPTDAILDDVPDPWAAGMQSSVLLRRSIVAKTKFTFVNGERRAKSSARTATTTPPRPMRKEASPRGPCPWRLRQRPHPRPRPRPRPLNWTLHLKHHTTPPASNIDILEHDHTPMQSDSEEEFRVPTSSSTGSSQRTIQYTDQQDGESEDSERTRPYDDHEADLVLDEAHWSFMTAEQKIIL